MWRTFSSLRTTTFLLVIIAAVLAMITFAEAAHGPVPGSTFPWYGAWWLQALFGLLLLQTLGWLATRRPRDPSLWVLHAGFCLLLGGAFVTSRWARRGTVTLLEGERTALLPTPRALALQVCGPEGGAHLVPLAPRSGLRGRRVELPGLGPATVAAFLPCAVAAPTLRPGPQGSPPGVELHLLTPHGDQTVVLGAGWAEVVELGPLHLLMGPPRPGPGPFLTLATAQGDTTWTLSLPEDAGRVFHAMGLAISPLDSQVSPRGIRVSVASGRGSAGPETLLVSQGSPTRSSWGTLSLSAAPHGTQRLFLWHHDRSWAFQYEDADTLVSGTFAQGDTFVVSPWPSMRLPLVVASLFPEAATSLEALPCPEGQGAPAVGLLLQGEADTTWVVAHAPAVVPAPGCTLSLAEGEVLPFWITLLDAKRRDYPHSSQPAMFESEVLIQPSRDSPGVRRTVRTNRPLRVGGWLMAQAEHGADAQGEWAGFQVWTDPGALPAGLGVLAALLALAWRLGRRVVVCLALLAGPSAHASTLEEALAPLVVFHEGRLKPLESLARDLELELGVQAPGGPLRWFLGLAMGDPRWSQAPLFPIPRALAPALGLPPGERLSLAQIHAHRERLEAWARYGPLAQASAGLLAARRLSRAHELVALCPGGEDGWWLAPTDPRAPPWARERWERLKALATIDERAAAREASALVEDQRRHVHPLPPRWRVHLELWWRRLNPPRLAPWWSGLALAWYAALAGRARHRLALPVLSVCGLQGLSVLTWVAWAGRLPLLNASEVAFLVLFLIPLVGVLAQRLGRLPAVGGAALVLVLAGSVGHGFFPPSGAIVRPPVAILRSPWREVHILSTMVSYALLFLLAGLASVVLARPHSTQSLSVARWIHRAGVLTLGLGIASGAAWAHQAWGRYWGWDPKEVWALISWLLFVAALHARASLGVRWWAGLVLAGFLALVFTFVGVTFLLPGLHSYG